MNGKSNGNEQITAYSLYNLGLFLEGVRVRKSPKTSGQITVPLEI